MTRQEHMKWSKSRAIESLDIGCAEAFASMASDLQKHPETANHKALEIGTIMLLSGMLSSKNKMRNFIDGFN